MNDNTRAHPTPAPQPEGERAMALAELKYFEQFMKTVPPDGYVMSDWFKQSSLDTIKAALSPPPALETVTVDDDALTIAYMKGVEDGKSRGETVPVLEVYKTILGRIYSMNTCSENALQAAETLSEQYHITKIIKEQKE